MRSISFWCKTLKYNHLIHNTMKKTIITMLLALAFMGLQANPVDVETAKSLGIKFMNTNTIVKSAQADLAYTAFTDDGQACFYVFRMQPKGFVIVSADDRAKPVLGYSTESAFSDEIPEGLESFFRNYRAGFTDLFASGDPRPDEAVRDWERLAATGRINNERITRELPQLLTCTWNQSALYNRRCPVDEEGPDGHVYAGCVATAMSQIMYYWQWPHTGRGAYIYEFWPYGQIGASFEDAHYRYELMPDFLDWTSTDEEIDAVAQLQYHAGVSVEMSYSPDGSGAFTHRVPDALSQFFLYDPSMVIHYRDGYVDSEWNEMLRENLDENMPLYYSASGNDGGHAFVCDGYDMNDMFHFNWGWQGFDNGYYAVNAFYLSNYSFPEGHAAIFGITPDYYPYCFCPEGLTDVQVVPVAEGTNRITLTSPSMNMGEWDIEMTDSIVFMRNNEVVHTEYNVPAGIQFSFDDNDAPGISHYSIFAFSSEYQGRVVKDTVMNGPTCTLNFHLHDSVGDGWTYPSLSVVDSRGNAITRLGLTEGYDETVKVDVPMFDEVTVHWAYGFGSSHETSFEIYDWDGRHLYSSEPFVMIGELCSVYVDCSDDVTENEQEAVSVYPNPTRSQIVIEGVEVAVVEVYNALGQQVMTSKEQIVDLSALETGVYFVRIESTDGQVCFEKVMKQ